MNLLFVSLSDLHLGEEDSLLTNLTLGESKMLPSAPGPCMATLINFLHAIKKRLNENNRIPYLILNGDVIELATSTYPVSTSYLRLFLTEIATRKIFDRIVYLTGNHDHGLWSLVRDAYFVESLHQQSEPTREPLVSHVTHLSIPRVSSVLNRLAGNLPRMAEPTPILAANPAFRLQSRSGHDFLFHHGHFLEDLYKMLSLIRDRLLKNLTIQQLQSQPLRADLDELEKENWPWLDFIWSGFTRAGKVGLDAEWVYETLSTLDGIKTLIGRISKMLRTELDIPWVSEGLEEKIFRKILLKILERSGVGSEERADPGREAFHEKVQEMCRRFVTHYLRKELREEGLHPAKDKTTLVFGHTHKPFMGDITDAEHGFGRVRVINSGGWVVESSEFWPRYGPGIVLGANDGGASLVTYTLEDESQSSVIKADSPDKTLELMDERYLLAVAVSNAVKVRQRYFKEKTEKMKRILSNLQV